LNGLSETLVIWRGEVTRAFKSGRVIVLLVLFGLFTGLALTTVGWIAKQVTAKAEEQATERNLDQEDKAKVIAEAKKQFVGSLYAADDEALTETLVAIPLVLLIVFSFSMRFVPAFVALMGFDQIAGEIGPRSIRYLVVRARRSSIMLGKFLAQFTVLGALMLITVAMMVVGGKLTTDEWELAQAALTFVKLWSASMVLAVPYLALTSLCSSIFRQAPVSLVFNLIVLFVIWFLALLGEAFRLPGEAVVEKSLSSAIKTESVLGYLRYGSVYHFAADLLHPHWQRFGAAGLAHLGYAMVFLGLGFVILRRRDL
jgi:ABC-2 type transport system permease protein